MYYERGDMARLETKKGNVIYGKYGGVRRFKVRGETFTWRVVGEQLVKIDNVKSLTLV